MRQIILAAFAVAISSAALCATAHPKRANVTPAQSAPATPFSFKDYALGSSIEDMKGRRFEPGKYGPRFIKCSDTDPDIYLRPLPEEAKIGVVRCHLFEQVSSSQVFSDIDLTSEFSARAAFSFYRGRLYKIEVTADVLATRLIIDSLVAKYGKPTIVQNGKMQVRSGAEFPQVTEVWSNKVSSVVLTSPDDTTETVGVLYTDDKAYAEVSAARAAAVNLKTVM